MQRLRILGWVALGGLLSACQMQQTPPEEGEYVDFVLQMMVESAKQGEAPNDADQAISAVESWRGAGEEGSD